MTDDPHALHERLLRDAAHDSDDLDALDPLADTTLEVLALLVVRAPRAAAALAACARLATLPSGSPAMARFVVDCLAVATERSPWSTVRRDAVAELARRAWLQPDTLAATAAEALERCLRLEPRWAVRARAAASLPLDALLDTLAPLHDRAAQVAALAAHPAAALFVALGDPHWRVRNALFVELRPRLLRAPWLVDVLEAAAATTTRPELTLDTPTEPRVRGALAWLRWLVTPLGAPPPALPPAPDPLPWRRAGEPDPEWWDDDPAVVHRNLAAAIADPPERPDLLDDALEHFPALLGFEHEAARNLAVDRVIAHGEPFLLTRIVRLLDEPRQPGIAEALELITGRLDMDRREATSRRLLLEPPEPAPAALQWALERVGRDYPLAAPLTARVEALLEHPHDDARRAAAEALVRSGHTAPLAALADDPCGAVRALSLAALADDAPLPSPSAPRCHGATWSAALAPRVAAAAAAAPGDPTLAAWLESLATHEAPAVRAALAAARVAPGRTLRAESLRTDGDPRVRAAALDADSAEAAWQDPSWLVRESAARLLRRRPVAACAARSARVPAATRARPADAPVPQDLVAPGTGEARLGISGHYALPEAGFARAIEAGVDLFVWEPNYATQTRFFRSRAVRHEVTHLVGTFEAEPVRVRRDVERALRQLAIERIGLFMVFWARSARRLDGALVDALEGLREEGRIARWGVSTHQRELAVELIERGVEVIMVRHNAAHRGIEDTVLPAARAHGTPVITFSAVMYGRMLERPREPWPEPPSALDCYRYSLSQPGVSRTLSAPASLAELEENLQALTAPPMSEAEVERIRRFGDAAAAESRAFARLVRWR